jgi:preprotein translocase subunit SecE
MANSTAKPNPPRAKASSSEAGADAPDAGHDGELVDASFDEAEDEDGAAEGESGLTTREDGAPNQDGLSDDEEAPSAALGLQRYVTAGFLGATLLLAYVLSHALTSTWESLANKAWFARSAPALAAIESESKSIYCMVIGGLLAIAIALNAYRRADLRAWADDVATELREVKWPTRSEVQGSTVVVLAASAVAAVYLLVLDRFWGFVTDWIYGS